MDGMQPPPHPHHDPHSHEEVASYLPEYVAEILAGGSPEARYPHVAAHLATCAACSLDFDELLLLTMATYDDEGDDPPADSISDAEVLSLAPPLSLPPPLSDSDTQRLPPEPLGVWRRGRQGTWAVTLSPGLLTRRADSALAGTARADDLLYDLLVPPEDGAPELRLEVYRASAGDEVYVRIAVDTLDPDALDMGGVEVTAMAGERVWHARTDGLGMASLRGIPRPALDGLELSVTPGR